ncbi:hypothetical protein Q5752_003275 [Cryptotrichosporon argae]
MTTYAGALVARAETASEADYFQTYGPIICGTLVSSFLLGISTVGHGALGHDPKRSRLDTAIRPCACDNAVARTPRSCQVLIGLNWATTTVDCSRVVKLLAIRVGDLTYADSLHARVEDVVGTVLTYVTSTYCQAFLTYRVITFSRAMSISHGRRRRIAGWAMTAFLLAMLLTTAVSSIGGSSSLSHVSTYSSIANDVDSHPVAVFNIMCEISLASAVLLDLAITILFTIELRHGRSGFGATNRVLWVLQSVLLQNAALATTTQIVQMAIFFSPQAVKSWFPFETLVIDKIYTLTVISLLIRPRLAHKRYHDEAAASSDIALSSARSAAPTPLKVDEHEHELSSSAWSYGTPTTPLTVTISRPRAETGGADLSFLEALAEIDEEQSRALVDNRV